MTCMVCGRNVTTQSMILDWWAYGCGHVVCDRCGHEGKPCPICQPKDQR
jgi:hypothetical protein